MAGEQVEVKNQVLTIVGMVMVVVGFPPFGRNIQVSEQSTSHGRGKELKHGISLSLRGKGLASNSMPSPSFSMLLSGKGQASTPAMESSP